MTPQEYIAAVPEDRRAAVMHVREVILENLPAGLEEIIDFGMLAYVVPLERSGATYNGKPLIHTALANQKNYMSLYLMGIYGNQEVKARFESEYRATGLRYDTGASCVRFRKLEDLPLDVVARAIRAVDIEELLVMHEGAKSLRRSKQ